MSVQALSWVFEYSQSAGPARLVLLSIANHASQDGDLAWPSVATIARESRLCERAVQYALPKLKKLGELAIQPGKGRGNTHLFSLPKFREWVHTMHPLQPEKVHVDAEKVHVVVEKGAPHAPEPSLTVMNRPFAATRRQPRRKTHEPRQSETERRQDLNRRAIEEAVHRRAAAKSDR